MIYSYGLVLWEIISQQRLPYERMRVDETARIVNEGERPHIPQNCPQRFANLMTRCWDGRPNLRPTAEEAAEEIHQQILQNS